MIFLAIFLGASAIGLSFALGFVAEKFGPLVASRFLERNPDYDMGEFKIWAQDERRQAQGYCFPVLFPGDLLYLLCLGGFLLLGSLSAARALGAPDWASWTMSALPALYMTADLAEGLMLSRFLLWPATITEEAVGRAKAATRTKIIACGLAIGQTLIVALAAAAA